MSSGQLGLVPKGPISSAKIITPSTPFQVQIHRDEAADGSGTYWGKVGSSGIEEKIGGPGANLITLAANAFFVDAIFGDDLNAAPQTLVDNNSNATLHKYKTILAALNDANSGDVIIVYPGTYVEVGFANLYKNGVTYYFYPGANVSATFLTTGAGHTCSVFGEGNFTGNTYCVRTQHIGAVTNFYCNNLNALMNTVFVQDGIMTVICNNIYSLDQGAVEVFDSTPLSDGTNNVYIEANEIRSFGDTDGFGGTVNNGTAVNGYDGYLKIKANRIISSPNSDSPAIHLDNFNVPNGRSTMIIECPSVEPGTINGVVPIVIVENHNNTFTQLICNIDSKFCTRVGLRGSGINTTLNQYTFEWHGDINLYTGGAVDISGDDQYVFLNGRFISLGDTYTVRYNSSPSLLRINGTVKNLTQAPGILKSQTTVLGSEMIIDVCTVIASFVTPSILCPALDTIKVIHSLAVNKDTQPAIGVINSIVGSTAYFDVNVQ